jgi:hypothetical protein
MKRETFYRLCIRRENMHGNKKWADIINDKNNYVAVKEQGFIYSFKTSDGNEIKLALEKNGTSYVRITEITTGMSTNTYQTNNYITYKSIIDYINNNQDYIDDIYRLMQERFQDRIKLLADLIVRGIIDEGKNYK